MAQVGMAALPSGRVTFMFTDIEGSTRLARDLPEDDWAAVLRAHDALTDNVIGAHAGVVVKHEGDGTFAAFSQASDAVDGAAALCAGIASHAWPTGAQIRLRIGLHTGLGRLTDEGTDYVGVDVHYAARLAAAGNGGQVLVSDDTRTALTRALPAGSSLVSAGRRRLKDFDDLRPVHCLVIPGVADDQRPLRTMVETNWPEALTAFVGRDEEVAAVSSFVERARIMTLTGPGGIGKTRLALSAASQLSARFPDGVVFVELAPVRDAALVLPTIAATIGVAELGGRPVLDVLRDALANKDMLLVLDNLEQLLPAAAGLVADLIRGSPRLRVLISSREPLRIAGEQEYPVPPLRSSDAQTLFLDRARLLRPDFAVTPAEAAAIDAITERLGGVPLAIELAAARVKLFSPTVLLERLTGSLDLLSSGARDLPERQRTLRATVAWSHDLLSPEDQVLFRRLSVFVGEWSADAATAVADPAGSIGRDGLDGLESLVDKSLLRTTLTGRGETRFGWHVFVREFASEQLTAAGERVDLERRHAETLRDLAIRVGPHLTESAAGEYLVQVDESIHDLRQAMAWALSGGDIEVGLRIVGSAWRWWQIRTNLREGRDWATRLLTHRAAQRDSIGRIEALAAAGGLAYWSTDYAVTRRAYVERLAIAERTQDRHQLANAHYDLAFVGVVNKDVPFLEQEAKQAAALFEEIGDRPGFIRSRQALVVGRLLAGDHATALLLEQQNLADFEASQSWFRIADSLMLLGAIQRLSGDASAALVSARKAIRMLPERVGGSTLAALGVIAIVEGESGDAELGARLTGAIRSIQAETGEALAPVSVLNLPKPVDVVRERLGDELAERLMDEGARLTISEAVELALGESFHSSHPRA